jgi:hypothetical protein
MHGMRVKSHKGQVAAQTNVNQNQNTYGQAPKAYWEGLKPVPHAAIAPVSSATTPMNTTVTSNVVKLNAGKAEKKAGKKTKKTKK